MLKAFIGYIEHGRNTFAKNLLFILAHKQKAACLQRASKPI